MESLMRRADLVPLAVVLIAGWVSLMPAHAAPPTVTPSPGYDARLQEQRAAPRAGVHAPVIKRVPYRRAKRTHAH